VKKNLKKAIKEDELVSWVEHTRAYAQGRGDTLRVVAVIALVVAIGGAALTYFRAQRDREARAAFSSAMETYHATTAAEAAPEATAPTRFANPAEKYRQALTELEGIERRHGSSALGIRARYYAALCKIELGQLDDAEAGLKTLASGRDADKLEPALARLALADVQRRKGQVDAAAEAYKQIIDDAGSAVPRDHALMNLAQMFEEARRGADAQAAYLRLVQEFPSSTYVDDAQKRVDFLKARG
jgi:predicted negative regulator of RcsB-dependent stress response